MTKKQLLRAVCFCLLLVFVLLGATNLLRDRETTLASFYSEPKDTVEAFIVGSSHSSCGFVPAILWQEYGINAHHVYSWAQPTWISYHYIKEGLKTQNPRVIVLEMFGMTYGHSYIMPESIDETNYENSFSIDPGPNQFAMTQTVKDCGLDLRDPSDFWNLRRYHSRWKYLDENAFTYDAHQQYGYLKGYTFMTQVHTPTAPLPDFVGVEESMPPYEKALEYLDKIVALCEEKGIDLVFTLTPYEYNEAEVKIYNYLAEYAAERNIPFLNYNTFHRAEAHVDFAQDLSDNGHTNYWGAEKITRHLGAYLAQNYEFSVPEELPNHEQLDIDANKMYRTVDVAGWLTGESTTEHFRRAANDGNIALLITARGSLAGLSNSVKTALRGLGLPLLNAQLEGATGSYVGSFGFGQNEEQAGEDAAETEHMFGATRIALRSNGTGVQVLVNDVNFADNSSPLQWVYYDTILQRPVAVGWLTSTDGTTMVQREILSSEL